MKRNLRVFVLLPVLVSSQHIEVVGNEESESVRSFVNSCVFYSIHRFDW